MATNITYGSDARLKILRGVEALGSAIGLTLGPRGRNVVIGPSASPTVTRDGATVASEIALQDRVENAGVFMMREVTAKTAEYAGDGTTTAVILAQAIYRDGVRNVQAGADPMQLKRGIDAAVAAAIVGLDRISATTNPHLTTELRHSIVDEVVSANPMSLGEIADNLGISVASEALRTHRISPVQALPNRFWGIGALEGIATEDMDRLAERANEHAGVSANTAWEAIMRRSKSLRLLLVPDIATAASGGDRSIGQTLATALSQVGANGVVTVEEGRGIETTVEFVDGLQFDRGYLSAYFVTDAERKVVELDDPYVLVTGDEITVMKDLLPILEQIAREGRALFIIASDVGGEALATLVVNHLRGNLKVAAIKAPSFGNDTDAALEDIVAVVGGRVITKARGDKLETATLTDLGTARRVRVNASKTTILAYENPDPGALQQRVRYLETKARTARSEQERFQLAQRVGRLTGSVAVIHVGAFTDLEMKDKRKRLDDALQAARAAMDEGVVPGGGVALLLARQSLDSLLHTGDVGTGVAIVRRAMEAPFRQLVANAGLDAAVCLDDMSHHGVSWGIDVTTGALSDMLDAGILDATKVTKQALRNACSIAGLMLTTEATLTLDEGPSD